MRFTNNTLEETIMITTKKIANIVKYASNYKNLDKYEGFCIKCGTKHKEVEPDAEKYPCKKCKKNAVYGLEEILIRLA